MNDVLTPEEYEMLLALGGQNSELTNKLAQQQKQSEFLRTNQIAPMRMAGRVAVAPSIFEVGGNVLRNYAAGQMDKEIMAGQQSMGANTNKQNQMIMRAILGGQRPAAPPAQPGGMYDALKRPGGYV